MKLCFTNEQTVKTWFERISIHKNNHCAPSLRVYSARNRIYSDGFNLYSYGTHFPMVRWFPEQEVFLTNCSQSYSMSTCKHQSYVRRHVPENRIEVGSMIRTDAFECPQEYLQHFATLIGNTLQCGRRARKYKQMYFEQGERLIETRNRFIKAFNLDAPELPEDVTAALVTLKLAA